MPLIVQATETERIADQLQRMYEGPAWHGPALKPLLEDVAEDQAAARRIPKTHSICELVLHMTAWLRIARERLSATETRDHTADEDWPMPSVSWTDTLAALDHEYRTLTTAIRAFPEDRLNDPAPATEPQTFYVLLHGVIQHIAYHAGQIAILKKND